MKSSIDQSVNIPVLSKTEGSVHFQRGLSLIELMISITLGLIILASLSTLFVNQTKTRVELDKSNRMIDNGRYAMDLLVGEVQLAGFFGEYVPPLSACSDVPRGIEGYDAGVTSKPTPPAGITTSQLNTGSDILAIRRVSTETPTAASAAVPGVQYMQVSHCQYDARDFIISSTPADFTLREKKCSPTTVCNPSSASTPECAYLRRMQENIYFISPENTPGDGIPTLKRQETYNISPITGLPEIVPLVEGIEYMQIEYGVDSNNTFVLTATTTDHGLVLDNLSSDPVTARVKQGMGVYHNTTTNQRIPDGYIVSSMTSPILSPATPGTITTQKMGSAWMVASTLVPLELVPLTIPYLSATITPNSSVLTSLSADPKLSLVRPGYEICGAGIPIGTTIAGLTSTTITLTKNATQCDATNPLSPCPLMPLTIPKTEISPKTLIGDGVADVFKASPSNTDWLNVVSVKITILARNTEESKGYTDTKIYTLGKDSAGNIQTRGPLNDGYKRHVFTQFIRLTNTAGRRE